MAFTEAQVKNLEAKLDAKARQDAPSPTTPRSPMSKAGMSSPRPTASLAMTPGTDTLYPRAAFGRVRANHHYGAAICQGPHRSQGWRDRHHSGRLWQRECQGCNPGEAHELALKGAETDATKRALATFGNPFGLALYDRELAGVRNRKALTVSHEEYRGPWLLSLPNGAGQSFAKADEFIEALSKALTEARDIEHLFAIWESNVDSVRIVNKQTNRSTPRGVIARNLVTQLKGSRDRPGKTE